MLQYPYCQFFFYCSECASFSTAILLIVSDQFWQHLPCMNWVGYILLCLRAPVTLSFPSVINRAVYTRENKPRIRQSAAYLSRELSHLYEHGLHKKLVRGLRKPRTSFLCRLYEQFAAYISRGLCNPRFMFPRINGPNVKFSLQLCITLWLRVCFKFLSPSFRIPFPLLEDVCLWPQRVNFADLANTTWRQIATWNAIIDRGGLGRLHCPGRPENALGTRLVTDL